MSYDQFPDEFEILKGSLENEDFERAESVLLMILKKQSDHPTAKLDLEKVRGKLGSISNYEFRVRAFLDQGEPDTAKKIMEEALTKFKKNKRILKLADFFKNAGAKAEEAAKEGAAGTESAAASSELPNLSDTFTEGTASKEEMSKVRQALAGAKLGQPPPLNAPPPPAGGAPGQGLLGRKPGEAPKAGAATGLGIPPKPVGPAPTQFGAAGIPGVGNAAPPNPGPAPASAGGRSGPAGGAAGAEKGAKASPEMEALQARNRRLTVAQKFDLMMVGLVGLMVVLVLGLVIAVMAVNSKASMPPMSIDAEAVKQFATDMARWKDPKMTPEMKEKYLRQMIEAPPNTFTLAQVEALYSEFAKLMDSDEKVKEYAERLYRWRVDNRRHQPAPLRAPIEPDRLAATDWNVEKSPPTYGMSKLINNEAMHLGIGVGVALIPGILLGLALAYCRLPGMNRLFQFVWEIWYATPIVAFLYLGVAGLASKFGLKSPSLLCSVMVGLAMVPHVAFYARQGFSNVIGKSLGKTIGLGALSAASAALAAFARFMGEGAVVVGVVMALGQGQNQPEFTKGVITAGREFVLAMQHLVPGAGGALVPMEDAATEIRWAVAQYLGFWMLLVAVALSLISQGLQVAVAMEGLKGVEPHESELPDAPQFALLAPLNLAMFGVGLVVLAIGGGLLLMSHLGAQSMRQDIGWTGVLDAAKTGDVTGNTLSIALMSGIVAFTLGGGLSLVPALFITGRRIRAVAESLLRIPTALPPVLIVIALIEIGLTQGAMSARIALVFGLAPLAAVMVFQTLEHYRRGPYIKDKQGRKPVTMFLNAARALDLVGALLFIMAVAMGAYSFVFAFGASPEPTPPGGEHFTTLSTSLMYSLTEAGHGLSSAPAYAYYSSQMTLVIAFTMLAFICRLLAEGAARLSLSRRAAD